MRLTEIQDFNFKLEQVKGWSQAVCDARGLDYYLTWVMRGKEAGMVDARRDVVLACRSAGWPINVIVTMTGCSEGTVLRILRGNKESLATPDTL